MKRGTPARRVVTITIDLEILAGTAWIKYQRALAPKAALVQLDKLPLRERRAWYAAAVAAADFVRDEIAGVS